MANELTVATDNHLPALVAELGGRAKGYAEAAKAANTRRAYRSDWKAFEAWCASRNVTALPAYPNTVLAFLVEHAGKVRVSTLQRRLSAIREAHLYRGIKLDTSSAAFRDVWRGIRRTHAVPANKKAPLLTAGLRRAIATLPDTPAGRRDRAMLLIGFGAALRRSELAGLDVVQREGAAGWIEETPDGLAIHLGATKTDQTGEGDVIGIPYGTNVETCPVRSYKAWLAVSGITTGPAFRAIDRHGHMAASAISDKAVATIVKRAVVAGEISGGATVAEATATAACFAGHSLRAGLATSAAANDAPGHSIQRQLRHKRFDTPKATFAVANCSRKTRLGWPAFERGSKLSRGKMLKLSRQQMDAIRQSELRFKLADYLEDRGCLIKPLSILTPIQIDSLHDACVDTLKNDAPAIEEFAAEQGCGPYLVVIRGVAGAYFVEAADHDDSGFFSELDEARSRLHFDFGEFVIESDD
jgi:integrase